MSSASSSSVAVFDLGRDHSRRELAGYGATPPNPHWPKNAKVCLSFVLNYEEGGEHNTGEWESNYNNDEHAETFLTESGVAASVPNAARYDRNLGTENGYEFGSHRGFHRILSLFKRNHLRFTSWAIGRAVQLNPQVVPLMQEAGCEVASHSWRWIDYWNVDEEEERKHVKATIEALKKASTDGRIPRGWYTGRQSVRTRRIVYEVYRELGALDQLYDSDACKCNVFGDERWDDPTKALLFLQTMKIYPTM
jgi:peptidoglycan/xylan/chitin deacetylase (PgdA/CDA1 family)